MVGAIVDGDLLEVEGADSLKTSGVDTEQIGVGTTLMMRVYAAL